MANVTCVVPCENCHTYDGCRNDEKEKALQKCAFLRSRRHSIYRRYPPAGVIFVLVADLFSALYCTAGATAVCGIYIFTPPDVLLPTYCCNHNSRRGPRNPRLHPYPLRHFQSGPAHSWRCDSFQWNPTSPPPRPIPPPPISQSVGQPVSQSISQSVSQPPNPPFHTAVSYPRDPPFRLS